MDPEVKELLDYLDEVIEDYRRYVENIGHNGLTASLLLNYRDEIQEILDELKYEKDLDLKDYWLKVRELDEVVREKKQELVREIGYENFKQYQIIQDPPLTRWWWYLDRQVAKPLPPARFWEFWKR